MASFQAVTARANAFPCNASTKVTAPRSSVASSRNLVSSATTRPAKLWGTGRVTRKSIGAVHAKAETERRVNLEDMKEAAESVGEHAGDAVKDAGKWVEGKAGDVKSEGKDAGDSVKEAASDAGDAIEEKADDLKSGGEDIAESVQEGASDAKDAVKDKADDAKSAAEDAADSVKEKADSN